MRKMDTRQSVRNTENDDEEVGKEENNIQKEKVESTEFSL